jgi:hypothetical protein
VAVMAFAFVGYWAMRSARHNEILRFAPSWSCVVFYSIANRVLLLQPVVRGDWIAPQQTTPMAAIWKQAIFGRRQGRSFYQLDQIFWKLIVYGSLVHVVDIYPQSGFALCLVALATLHCWWFCFTLYHHYTKRESMLANSVLMLRLVFLLLEDVLLFAFIVIEMAYGDNALVMAWSWFCMLLLLSAMAMLASTIPLVAKLSEKCGQHERKPDLLLDDY